MAKSHARHAILSETPTYDPDKNLRVVIETPRGSPNKYSYDPACDCFELKTVMPAGMSFPYDFGFIPSTLGEDGDPLDVLVLMDSPVVPGCVLKTRPIGVIEAEQKEDGGDWLRNDRLVAVAVHSRTHNDAKTLKDLRPHLVDEITSFFVDYNKLHGKKFKPIGAHGPHRALALVDEGRARRQKRGRRST
ncbi:MAG TPA: inorganic diphosphatase [Rhizomicrobium sp.]